MRTTPETLKDEEFGRHLPFGKLLRLQDAAIPNSPYGAAKVLSLPKEIVCGVEEVEGAREAVLQWQLSLWAERLDAPSQQYTPASVCYFSPGHVQLFGEAMLRYHAIVHKLPSVVTRIGWLVSEDDPTSVGEVERAFMRGL